jgi:DNA-binding PadR family transcriptional regulator
MSYLKIYLVKETNMFGMRHCGPRSDEHRAGGRGWRRRFGESFGEGGRHGMGGGDFIRAGKMLAQGDVRLLALALIAEQPRHGYDIIKVLEEKTAGWYAPSPGMVYPTLTYLEEVGYVTGQAEGAKKLYTITEEGKAHLAENRDFVDAVLERLTAFGEKVTRMRRRFGRDAEAASRDDETLPRSVRGAFQDLSEAVRELLGRDRSAKARVIDVIDRATAELKGQTPLTPPSDQAS